MEQIQIHKHYLGAAHSFEILSSKDKNYRPDVTILKTFFINDKPNVNDWQATWEGLKQDAKELVGVPLVLQEDLQHPKFSVQEMFDRGTIFDYDIDEEKKQIIVYVRITDHKIIERIKSGELEYVSPAVIPRGSETMKKIDGVDVLSRTLPLHLAIVGDPAYGKDSAKMTHLCTGDGEACLHRLKTMTASKGITCDDKGDAAFNKCKKADAIDSITQTPLIKKMIASSNRIASDMDRILTASKYHTFEGKEGRWINAKGIDIFVAREQTLSEAMMAQCGCSKLASTEEKGSWITVKGNHIFIPDGKDAGDVIKEHFDNKEKSKPKGEKRETKEKVDKNGFNIIRGQKIKISKELDDLYGTDTIENLKSTWNSIPVEDRKTIKELIITDEFNSEHRSYMGLHERVEGGAKITIYGADPNEFDFEVRLETTIFHEVGHAVDYEKQSSDSKGFENMVDSNPPINSMLSDLSVLGYDGNDKYLETFAELYTMDKWLKKYDSFDDYPNTVESEDTFDKLKKFLK